MRGTPTDINRTAHVVMTAQAVRKNLGAARSLAYLASLGHKVFILEDEALSRDKAQHDKFLTDYGLSALVTGKAVFMIESGEPLLGAIRQFSENGAIQTGDVMMVKLQSETAGDDQAELNILALADDVLGVQSAKRADYPVAVLGARLLLEPAKIREQLGDRYLVQQTQQHWLMTQTPEGDSLSSELTDQIAGYQALSSAA